MPLRLAPSVEEYSLRLMRNAGLTPGAFFAAQYRAGWSWRHHTIHFTGQPWTCYGPGSIRNWIAQRFPSGQVPRELPIFLLTNVAPKLIKRDPQWHWGDIRLIAHEPGVPVPIQILSEMRIASLANTLVLNPGSSFRDGINSLRQMDRKEAETRCRLSGGTKRKCAPKDKLFYMQHKDVIPGEHCGCESSDEDHADGARTLKRGGFARLCGYSNVTYDMCGFTGPRTARNRTACRFGRGVLARPTNDSGLGRSKREDLIYDNSSS